ncbi:MAG: hypothetical protein FJ224_07170 [Lentisphaerae bacterium]|nr:hypothetical protein [Lentisphaerota bacterium]
MTKPRIGIVGCGFAGLAAARECLRCRGVETVVVSDRDTFDYLPLLPDVAGGRLTPEAARTEVRLLSRGRFRFIKAAVECIDGDAGRLSGSGFDEGFDAIIIASGSSTRTFGRADVERNSLRLDSVADAVVMRKTFLGPSTRGAVVVGGGYTGIETASHLSRLAESAGDGRWVVLVEASESLLGRSPAWMGRYAADNLKRMGVEVVTGCTVSAVEPDRAVLSSGRVLSGAVVAWVPGVAGGSVLNSVGEVDRQNRLVVDAFLGAGGRCFAAGDCAHFEWKGEPLRMSVQFAITQGRAAGRNAVSAVTGRAPREYRPFDPGYVVPMANGRSCGVPLGVSVRGRIPTALHYFMCAARAPSMRAAALLLCGLASRERVSGST